jgi:hypothetical protein
MQYKASPNYFEYLAFDDYQLRQAIGVSAARSLQGGDDGKDYQATFIQAS